MISTGFINSLKVTVGVVDSRPVVELAGLTGRDTDGLVQSKPEPVVKLLVAVPWRDCRSGRSRRQR
jgi:hypothetical protein